jgi:hypothetical protein
MPDANSPGTSAAERAGRGLHHGPLDRRHQQPNRGAGRRTADRREQPGHPAGPEGDAAPHQPPPQGLLSGLDAPEDGRAGAPEFGRGVPVGPPLQHAHQDRGAVFLREPGQFLVEQFVEFGVAGRWAVGRRGRVLGRPPPRGGRTLLGHDPVRDAVEPPADGPTGRHPEVAPGEGHERGLEGVVGVRGVAEGPAAHAPDQFGMPADEGGERAVVVLGGERPDQVGVRPPVVGPGGGHEPEVRQTAPNGLDHHSRLTPADCHSPVTIPAGAILSRTFFERM